MKKSLITVVLLIALATSLSGCTTIAMTTYDIATNPLALKVQIEDKLIDTEAHMILYNYPGLNNTRYIHLMVFNRAMFIVGQVPSHHISRGLVHQLARLKNVSKVYDYLTVGRTYTDEDAKSDIFIYLKVKAAIYLRDDLLQAHYLYCVYDGVVYLFGESSPRRLKDASQLISRIEGVRRVVTFFAPSKPLTVEKNLSKT